MKVLLLENIHAEAEKVLTARGYEVEMLPGALDEDDLIKALDGVSLLGIRSRTHITEKVLANSPQLLAVGAFCIGTNQINIPAAARHGVSIFNAPYSNTRSVVELAVSEIIALARRLTDRNRALHEGVWDKTALGSHEVRGRSLGIVGYGNIGSQLSIVAEALGMQVYFYDIVDKLALGNAKRVDSLEELLATAETISVHVDGRASNANLFGEREFALMRRRSLFLNLCRGHIVDHDALYDALVSGHIAGAAVDVFPTEPINRGDKFTSKLQNVPNVILTPHVGGSTQEAQFDIGRFTAGKLADYEQQGNTSMSLSLPEVGSAPTDKHRIVHLHRNVPGVMARLNSVIAEHDINIGYQSLATSGELGYAVTDLTGNGIEGLAAQLAAMEETVRVRVL